MSVWQYVFVIPLFVVSWGFIIFGMISIFSLKNLYTRILSTATIDSVGSLTMLLALLIATITGYEYVLRFGILIAFLLITNPISSHVNIRSAYLTGYNLDSIHMIDDQDLMGGDQHGR